MNRLQKIAIAAAAIGALAMLGVASAQDRPARAAALNEEISRQAAIFNTTGDAVPEGYVIDRSLLAYTFMLPREFDQALADLTPADRWLDIGAGRGQAVLDYYTERYDAMHAHGKVRRGKKAQAVAISIEDRRTSQWRDVAKKLEAGQIRYLAGKRLSEYAPQELGRFQLITDMVGGFSYTDNLARFMTRVLDLLEVNGNFYTLLQDVRTERGQTPPYHAADNYLTEIADAGGAEIKVCAWLKSITCVEVTCEARSKNQLPTEVYRVRKLCNDVAVPALSTAHFEAGTPPGRRFVLQDNSLAAPAQTRFPAARPK